MTENKKPLDEVESSKEIGLSDDDLREISEITTDITLNPKSDKDDLDPPALDANSTAATEDLTDEEPLDEQSHVQDNDDLSPSSTAVDQSADYFDDDEEFLKGDDKLIHSDPDIALFKQDEGVVSWELLNFYKENGKPRSKIGLRNDPPVMRISSSSGDTAEFLVTQQFAKSLSHILEDVNRAYFGVSPVKEHNSFSQVGVKNKIRSIGQWMRDHKFKSAVGFVVVGLLFVSVFVL